MVKLLGWHAIVLHWVHLGIVYIKTTLCRLLQDGIALDDEGIDQIAAHYLLEAWGLVGHDASHRIIRWIVLYTQVILHQGWHHVVMGGAVGILMCLHTRYVPYHRYT